MRGLTEIAIDKLTVPSKEGVYYDKRLAGWWLFDCHGFWYNIALIFPSFLFLVYLGLQARKSYTKLCHGRSYITISYYGLLWSISVLNLVWCSLQAWECTPAKELSWNLLTLFTAAGMLFMEISLVAFLLQGNNASGPEALKRTFVVSGIIVGVDILLKAIYVFAFGVPLFIDHHETRSLLKWGLWIFHKLLLTAAYGSILFLYHSKWRENLPARPAFYKYISVMFCLSAVALFACGFMANGLHLGIWLNNLTVICYHSLYLPLLYVTFLADFFQEEDFLLENVYYSEMKDAGLFDADWE